MSDLLALLSAMGEFVKSAESATVAALIIALFSVMVSHAVVWLAYRARLRDVRRHLEDALQQRDYFAEALLKSKGISPGRRRRGKDK